MMNILHYIIILLFNNNDNYKYYYIKYKYNHEKIFNTIIFYMNYIKINIMSNNRLNKITIIIIINAICMQ